MQTISALTVVYETTELFKIAYHTFRVHNPDMPIIVVDGSKPDSECYQYVTELAKIDRNVTAHQVGYNIGHGRGMNYGIHEATTDLILIFDSDVEFLKNPVPEMVAQMTPETYGIGWVYPVGRDGFDYGTWPEHLKGQPIPYLHPYFMIINRRQYLLYHQFVHHGAPCYKAMIDLHERGESHRLINFPGTPGHSRGQGANWTAVEPEYIRHDFGGTRTRNRELGLKEIPGTWER